MPLQHELAWLLKQRCEEIGLTSQRLAELSGAEFETVRQLLDGMGCHISISDAECIANAVGLGLGVLRHRRDPQRTQGAAVIAARSASTSLTEPMPPDALIDSLARGFPQPSTDRTSGHFLRKSHWAFWQTSPTNCTIGLALLRKRPVIPS